jgi:hypothetical protein
MAHQGFDLQLTRYDERGWRATFYTTGMEQVRQRFDQQQPKNPNDFAEAPRDDLTDCRGARVAPLTA